MSTVSFFAQLDSLYSLPIEQPWESAVSFGNAVVNAVLCWFYDSKKMLL